MSRDLVLYDQQVSPGRAVGVPQAVRAGQEGAEPFRSDAGFEMVWCVVQASGPVLPSCSAFAFLCSFHSTSQCCSMRLSLPDDSSG